MSYPTKKLQEILDKTKFTIGKIKTSDYLPVGKSPIIDQGKSLIAGYSNNDELVYNGNLPVIVYGDRTNIVKYVDFSFIGGADGIKVFPFKKDFDVKYCYYLIETFKPKTQGYRRHFSFFKDIYLPLPPLSTQKLIVQKLDLSFEKIDKSIELTKKNLENIEELNKSVLEEVFREGEFEKVELGKIITLNYGKGVDKEDKNENGLFDVYGANGVMYKSDKFLFDGNSIIVGRKGSAGALKRVSGKFWASDVTYFVTINGNDNLDYLYNGLKYLNIPSLAQGVKPGINRNHVYDLKIPLPPIKKQKEIVAQLDKVFEKNKALKESHEKKLKDLEEMKQSLLKEAFEGRLIP